MSKGPSYSNIWVKKKKNPNGPFELGGSEPASEVTRPVMGDEVFTRQPSRRRCVWDSFASACLSPPFRSMHIII